MPNYILKSPLVLQQGTGFTISDTSELFVKERTTVTLSIPQSVASSSVVEFNQLTSTATIIIDDSDFDGGTNLFDTAGENTYWKILSSSVQVASASDYNSSAAFGSLIGKFVTGGIFGGGGLFG